MRSLTPRLLIAFVVLFALTACGRTGGDGAGMTASMPADQPPVEHQAFPAESAAEEPSTPAPEPEAGTDPVEQASAVALESDQPADLVRQAYLTLSTRLYRAVEPEAVLSAAWSAVREEARTQGFSDAASLRRFGDDAVKSIDGFVGQFNRLVTGPGSDLNSTKLAQAAIRGMTSAINDSHTRFVPSSVAATRIDGGYSGIGVVTRQDGDRGLEINEVYQGGPADQAGLRAGDRIVRVNGDDITNRAQAAVSELIRGPSGTTVQLTLQTATGETREVTVTRGEISIPVISARMEGEQIGYIRVASFPRRSRSRDAAAEFETHLARLEAAGAKAFVLDLRGNPGGDPFTSVNIASNFTQDGPIFIAVDRDAKRTVYPANRNRKLVSGPVVVLIDTYSASGAEVVASAIKEYGAGYVIGQRTCGCLSVGQTVRLPDNSEIVVTVQQALTGRYERSLEGNGLEPDEAVRMVRTVAGVDTALARAIDYLHQQLP